MRVRAQPLASSIFVLQATIAAAEAWERGYAVRNRCNDVLQATIAARAVEAWELV